MERTKQGQHGVLTNAQDKANDNRRMPRGAKRSGKTAQEAADAVPKLNGCPCGAPAGKVVLTGGPHKPGAKTWSTILCRFCLVTVSLPRKTEAELVAWWNSIPFRRPEPAPQVLSEDELSPEPAPKDLPVVDTTTTRVAIPPALSKSQAKRVAAQSAPEATEAV